VQVLYLHEFVTALSNAEDAWPDHQLTVCPSHCSFITALTAAISRLSREISLSFSLSLSQCPWSCAANSCLPWSSV